VYTFQFVPYFLPPTLAITLFLIDQRRESKMAFDRPIEADRIGDFNLFSAFVRAPLWILGGVLGSSSNEDDCAKKGSDICSLSSQQTPGIGGSSRVRVISNDALPFHSSRAINSEEPVDQLHRFGECSVEWHSSADDSASRGLKRGKNLSWSDESGRSLVEFNDEVSESYFFLAHLFGAGFL
jgi:hypothetical protein